MSLRPGKRSLFRIQVDDVPNDFGASSSETEPLLGKSVTYVPNWVIGTIAIFAVSALVVGAIGLGIAVNRGPHHDPSDIRNLNVTGSFLVSNTVVLHTLNISRSNVIVAPLYIIVGDGLPGVNDWPYEYIDPNSLKRQASKYRSKRSHSALIPITPGYVPFASLPHPDTVYVKTINQALALLQGKVITNTTILIRAGVYQENVAFSGFVSQCGGIGISSVNNSLTPSGCRGLTVIGDGRRVAGYTWMHGAREDIVSAATPAFGSDGGIASVVCSSSNSVTVTRPFDPSWSSTNSVPDFELLGVVPGDNITLFDQNTGTWADKQVTSVVNNTLSFSPTGCALNGLGSSLTILPNRKIVGQSPSFADFDSGIDAYHHSPGLALSIKTDITLFGLHVTEPDTINSVVEGVCELHSSDTYLSGLVCDNRYSRTSLNIPLYIGAGVIQQLQGSHRESFSVIETNDEQYHYKGHITTIGGQVASDDSRNGLVLETLSIVGGIFVANRASSSIVNLKIASSSSLGGILMRYGFSYLEADAISIFGSRGRITLLEDASITVRSGWILVETTQPTCISLSHSSSLITRQLAGFDITLYNCSTGIDVQSGSEMIVAKDPIFSNVATAYRIRDTGRFITGQNQRITHLSIISNSAFTADWRTQLFESVTPVSLTLSDTTLSNMQNKVYSIFSTTANAHNITLTGTATWDGVSKTATFGGAIGDGFEFRALPTGIISVLANKNVVFA